MKQITKSILMIRPVNFRMNEQTAVNNYFMEEMALKNAEINSRAQQEFDSFVEILRDHGVEVIVVMAVAGAPPPPKIPFSPTTGYPFTRMVQLWSIPCLLKIEEKSDGKTSLIYWKKKGSELTRL